MRRISSIAEDPLRPRTWRWDRVEFLNSEGREPNRSDDKITARACRFLRRWNQLYPLGAGGDGYSQGRLSTLYREYPHIGRAFDIWRKRDFSRWAVEALVLGGSESAEIAEHMPCDPSLIQAYEDLFYDVRDRSKAKLFVLAHILGPALQGGMSGDDCDFFWKSLSYYMGPESLYNFWNLGGMSQDMINQLDDMIKSQARRNGAAAMFRPIDRYRTHEAIEEYLAILATEAEDKSREFGAKTVQGIDSLLQSVTYAVASVQQTNAHPLEGRVGTGIKQLADRGFFDKDQKDTSDLTKGAP